MKKKIGDLCTIYSGGDKPSVFSNVKTDALRVPVYANATEKEGLLGFTDSSRIKGNSITISARGSGCGAVFYREDDYVPVVRLLSLIPNASLVYPKYLYFLLKSKKIKSFGSGQPQITIPQISEMEVDIVDSMVDQKKIADFLWKIETTIKGNNEAISLILELTNKIYSYWFNQFEFPDATGKPYKTNGGDMSYSSALKKEIPSGWNVETIYKNRLCSCIDVGVKTFETKNYLATANVNGLDINDGDNVTFENRESRANMQPVLNSVWFAKMKSSIKHIFVSSEAQWIVEKYIFSTGFSGLKCNDVSFPYIASVISQPYFEVAKDTLSHGATQQGVNNDDLNSIPIIVPPQEVLEKYCEITKKMFEKINCIQLENQTLNEILNFTIPLLLNGQLRLN